MYKYQNKKTGAIVEFNKPIDPKQRQEFRLVSFIQNTKMNGDDVMKKTFKKKKKHVR